MGITNVETCTYEKFCEELNNPEDFTGRCNELPFNPNFVITWKVPSEDMSKEIDKWYNDKEQFIGNINKHWLCQIEFEKEEDVVAFKLRWM